MRDLSWFKEEKETREEERPPFFSCLGIDRVLLKGIERFE